jgi:hypothetical protein
MDNEYINNATVFLSATVLGVLITSVSEEPRSVISIVLWVHQQGDYPYLPVLWVHYHQVDQ